MIPPLLYERIIHFALVFLIKSSNVFSAFVKLLYETIFRKVPASSWIVAVCGLPLRRTLNQARLPFKKLFYLKIEIN